MFQALCKLGLEGIKEALQVGTIEGVVENQEFESARCYAITRRLVWLRPARFRAGPS
jgi:hypothetical protein